MLDALLTENSVQKSMIIKTFAQPKLPIKSVLIWNTPRV